MKRARLITFVLLVMLQVLVVGNMARSREAVLESGEQVTLALRPVDPRDLFRGDFVVLSYEISRLDLQEVPWAAAPPHDGQIVLVELATDGEIHGPVRVVDPVRHGVPAIRGTVDSANGQTVWLRYGIEEYFVPEGTGREIERAAEVRVVVAVSENGHAVIDHLIVDGRRWQLDD